jgi:hypothetical protein
MDAITQWLERPATFVDVCAVAFVVAFPVLLALTDLQKTLRSLQQQVTAIAMLVNKLSPDE